MQREWSHIRIHKKYGIATGSGKRYIDCAQSRLVGSNAHLPFIELGDCHHDIAARTPSRFGAIELAFDHLIVGPARDDVAAISPDGPALALQRAREFMSPFAVLACVADKNVTHCGVTIAANGGPYWLSAF